jgi:hypothetical protein
MSDSKPKNVDSVSLRSAAHATDSTCNGCSAKSAATSALDQRACVVRNSNQKTSNVFAA